MQPAYHYALIRGMLATPAMMALVWLAWSVYTLKTMRFVAGTLAGPDHLFLQMLRLLSFSGIYSRFLRVQALLLLPVTGYALIVAGVAWYEGQNGAAFVGRAKGTVGWDQTIWLRDSLRAAAQPGPCGS
jgi:hypothetical protein